MKIKDTAIPGTVIVEPQVFGDRRGFFLEVYHETRYRSAGISARFVQDNLSQSANNVLRGLHIQSPKPQGKLVSVVSGNVLDVAVDVRVGSPTFGKHITVELSGENRRQLWIPRGFAHGFVVRSETATFFYKCDEFYSPADELVLKWNDPEIGIDWECASPIISERDSNGLLLSQLLPHLPVWST